MLLRILFLTVLNLGVKDFRCIDQRILQKNEMGNRQRYNQIVHKETTQRNTSVFYKVTVDKNTKQMSLTRRQNMGTVPDFFLSSRFQFSDSYGIMRTGNPKSLGNCGTIISLILQNKSVIVPVIFYFNMQLICVFGEARNLLE